MRRSKRVNLPQESATLEVFAAQIIKGRRTDVVQVRWAGAAPQTAATYRLTEDKTQAKEFPFLADMPSAVA